MSDKVWVRIDTNTLVSGGGWKDSESTIRATLFAKLLELARDRVKVYQSDLFHDALWIKERVTGPMSFEWIARESGTFIGDSTLHIKDEDWPNATRYRFEIRMDDKQRWVLDTYEAVMERPHTDLSTEECEFATTAAGCIYHPADIQPKVQTEEILEMIFPENPTLRNEFTTRKVNTMDSIISDLREKMQEAESTKEQLEEYKYNIDEAVSELETYMSDLDDLIGSLESLPEVSLYVDLDTVSFDS